MQAFTERLEVRLPAQTLQLLHREAKERGISVAQLVREAIDRLLQDDRQASLQAAEARFQIEAPVAEWPQMEREIEEGRLEGAPR